MRLLRLLANALVSPTNFADTRDLRSIKSWQRRHGSIASHLWRNVPCRTAMLWCVAQLLLQNFLFLSPL